MTKDDARALVAWMDDNNLEHEDEDNYCRFLKTELVEKLWEMVEEAENE